MCPIIHITSSGNECDRDNSRRRLNIRFIDAAMFLRLGHGERLDGGVGKEDESGHLFFRAPRTAGFYRGNDGDFRIKHNCSLRRPDDRFFHDTL